MPRDTDSTVTISPIELLALEKLAVVGHALAGRIEGAAAHEQRALVGVLDDIIARAKRASR